MFNLIIFLYWKVEIFRDKQQEQYRIERAIQYSEV